VVRWGRGGGVFWVWVWIGGVVGEGCGLGVGRGVFCGWGVCFCCGGDEVTSGGEREGVGGVVGGDVGGLFGFEFVRFVVWLLGEACW